VTAVTVTPDEVRIGEIYLAGESAQGPAVVGGLSVVANDRGLTVVGPQPNSVHTLAWGRASTIELRKPATLPDGRAAVILEVEIDGRRLRFFVPAVRLGPAEARALEERLCQIARVPPALTPPVAIGDTAAVPNRPLPVSPVVNPIVSGPVPDPCGPPGVEAPAPPPVSIFADPASPPGATSPGVPPATGGTLTAFGSGFGPSVQVSKKRRKGAKPAVVALVVLVACGAAGYLYESHRPGTGSSDSLVAAQVNLSPGDVPGWKGVAGTTAGAFGAQGLAKLSVAKPTSFARCTRSSISDADSALALLGFSRLLPPAPGVSVQSSSPLFEDPSLATTTAWSDVLVTRTQADAKADLSVFAGRGFAGCYARYLDSVVPALVGGAASGISSGRASVKSLRLAAPNESVYGFSEVVVRGGKRPEGPLYGTIVVAGRGRVLAVLETLSTKAFPASEGLRLLSSVEQNVAGQST
jgi:hypothetical protein